MTRDPIHTIADHVVGTSFSDIPQLSVEAAKVLILDTLAVGIGGSSGPMAAELADGIGAMGSADEARVWARGDRLPAWAAAQCNAYQAHCQEYDSVHEGAVAHVMTAILPTTLAGAERVGGVSGARLLEAAIVGVDIGASIGVAATSGLRFFRPGTAGAWGATAALGKLMGLDRGQLIHAFSLCYGQMCGTMQAHTEGSGLLAMQVGFNARNAVMACDLAARGFTGPENILSGPFGYFRLFEDGGDIEGALAGLGQTWRVDEVSLKPFPSGRATHGILDGCLALQEAHGFSAKDVASIALSVPPLIDHLVGRPPKREMAINYARLCARYVLSCALHGRGVEIADFTNAAYTRDDRQDLAHRITMNVRTRDDPNALVPIGVEIMLDDGRALTTDVRDVYGSPAKPMSADAHELKVREMGRLATPAMSDDAVTRLITAVESIEQFTDVRRLVDLVSPGAH